MSSSATHTDDLVDTAPWEDACVADLVGTDTKTVVETPENRGCDSCLMCSRGNHEGCTNGCPMGT